MLDPNSFAPVALEASYNYGDKWLDDLLKYVYSNYKFMESFLSDKISDAEITELQGTYLAWVNFKKYKLNTKELDELFVRKAGVAPGPGHMFGPEGAGFMRFNLACPRSVLEEGMNRVASAFSDL